MSTRPEQLKQPLTAPPSDDPLVVAGVSYRSRLLVGTGKYRDLVETRRAIEASGLSESRRRAKRDMSVGLREFVGSIENDPSLSEPEPPASRGPRRITGRSR